MYYRFLKYIREKKLFNSQDSILLAVSGGRDSMFMADLFLHSVFNFGIIHFNHKTREGESDRDENFVKLYCEEKSIPFYSIQVDIKSLIKQGRGNNFQDVARRERYKWFEQVRSNHGYDFIATAHNSDDNIETFLYKTISGAGLGGLQGIKPKLNKVVRPILNISRAEIDEYILKNKIQYIEDSSNSSDKYSRNYLRHRIIPELKKMNNNFEKQILVTINNLSGAYNSLNFLLEKQFKNHITEKGRKIFVSKAALTQVDDNIDVIYYLFSKYNFNIAQITDMIKSKNNTGNIYLSNSHELLVDRENIIIRKLSSVSTKQYLINEGTNEIDNLGLLKILLMKNNENIQFDQSKKYIDVDKLKFPLTLRKWQAGDRFKPFGLKGKTKKIKKYLIDKKVNKFDKEETYVLLSQNEICYVMHSDISYDFRITDTT
ncbi:MAG TPA: tRNA lysidine(34) synthetase TilS, partial [Bacteroidetes bacterium]|nr:tRNA lysidine(34) synthetase TilS [Bacteroidota bacterium]